MPDRLTEFSSNSSKVGLEVTMDGEDGVGKLLVVLRVPSHHGLTFRHFDVLLRASKLAKKSSVSYKRAKG